MRQTIKSIALSIILAVFFSQAHAASVGVGIGRAAEFSGSDESQFIPMAAFEFDTPIGILKSNQLGAKLDLIKSGALDTGPILRANLGRNDSVSDDVVAALPEIEATAEAGWFIGSGIRLESLGLQSNAIIIGDIAVVTDIGDGHGGTHIKSSIGLVMPVAENLRFIPSISVNYADDNYTHAFYGVDAANASTDLSSFQAKGGIESTQFALVAVRTINAKWSMTGIAAYNTLQGDAADSPITGRGSKNNSFAGVVLNYTF